MREQRRFIAGAVTPAAAIVFTLSAFAFLLLIYLSFFDLTTGQPWGVRRFVGFENYQRVFSRPDTLRAILRSLIYPVLVTLGSLLVGFCIALVVVGRSPFLKAVLVAAMIVPQTIPPIVAGVMWKLILNTEFGILNYLLLKLIGIKINWLGEARAAFFSIILVDVWRSSAFMGLVSLAAMEALPKELFEAASIDGANYFQRIVHVTIPLLLPVLIMACILQTIAALHAFDHIFIMTTGGPGTATNLLSVAAYRVGMRMAFLGQGSVYAVLLALVGLALSFLLIRLMRRQFE